jgi:hypothetical protein
VSDLGGLKIFVYDMRTRLEGNLKNFKSYIMAENQMSGIIDEVNRNFILIGEKQL